MIRREKPLPPIGDDEPPFDIPPTCRAAKAVSNPVTSKPATPLVSTPRLATTLTVPVAGKASFTRLSVPEAIARRSVAVAPA